MSAEPMDRAPRTAAVGPRSAVAIHCAGILAGGRPCAVMVAPPKRLCRARHIGQRADAPSAQPGPADTLLFHVRAARLPVPAREWRFHPSRQWRLDFAWPERMVAAEIEGGTFMKGRHTSGTGFEHDAEKYDEAVLAGWRVLRFTTAMVEDGRALALLERALEDR